MKSFAYAAIYLIFLCMGMLGSGSTSADELGSKNLWKIVNYWSEWCGPCRTEIPELNQLSKELESFDVIVVGVNFDEDAREKTLQIAKRMGIEFPTLTIATVKELRLMAPDVLPTTYILSPDNAVKAKLIGAQDRARLKAKLAEIGFSD